MYLFVHISCLYSLLIFHWDITIFCIDPIRALSILWIKIHSYEIRTRIQLFIFGLLILSFNSSLFKSLKKYSWVVYFIYSYTYDKIFLLFSCMSVDDNCFGLWFFVYIIFNLRTLVISLPDFWKLMFYF